MINDYDIVIGLEVHVELKTKTKIFCSCPTYFGAQPNTLCCPVCAGLPGALPTLNAESLKKAVIAGMALNCEISKTSMFDRKNYFYPDSPKAYQITQFYHPICKHGYVEIDSENSKKKIRIKQIHLEEDAGKLTHIGDKTAIDLNRCGIPLIEIVSEPDISSADEAKEYLRRLREALLYTDVSDCKMNEGSMRCDINISVKKKGAVNLGTRTEIKNVNSIAFVGKAIDYEAKRQIDKIENGEKIISETRRFDESASITVLMRTKESSEDYRYFPEPDLTPIFLDTKWLEDVRECLPVLPEARRKIYQEKYMIGANESSVLTSERDVSDYFEACAEHTPYKVTLANLIITDILALKNIEKLGQKINPEHLAALATLLGENTINSSTAKKLLTEMWECDIDPKKAVTERDLAQITDEKMLSSLIRQIIEIDPKPREDYKNGKKAAAKTIIGKLMKETAGRADPKLATILTEKILNE